MGNDGGSIPTRRELVKEAAKALNTTQTKEVLAEQQSHSWSNDPLTRKPLSAPIVSDSGGVLYNKDSIIEYLLLPTSSPEKSEKDAILQGRVSSLKDVVEVKFGVEEGGVSGLVRSNGEMGRREKWVCGVTGTELGPGSKAVYLVPCGCAFAGSVVREVKDGICLQCNAPYAENDVIPILPTVATDIARLTLRAKTLKEKGLTHSLKKAPGSKKRKKGAATDNTDATTNGETTSEPASKSKSKSASVSPDESTPQPTDNTIKEPSTNKKSSTPQPQPTNTSATNGNNIKNSSTASLTRKVLEEQEQRNKRRKLQQNDNVKSLFSSRDGRPDQKNSSDYMTRGFSIGQK